LTLFAVQYLVSAPLLVSMPSISYFAPETFFPSEKVPADAHAYTKVL